MESNEGRTTEALETIRDPALDLRAYKLVVIEGPDAGAEQTLDATTPGRLLVGQSKSCQLVLADRQVSRRHAAVDFQGTSVKVVDLDSTNGTRVNGVRVREAFLEAGDRVRVGGTTLRLDAGDAPSEPIVSPSTSFGRVVGASVAMRRLYPLCERLALSDLPVSIEGETGVGKELLAEALHEGGPRRNKPFVVFDCAGVRGEKAVPLLFGDGASGGSILEQASGGTLLLDEIAELDDDAQARLVRFIDRGEVRRDGGRAIEADVRLLATSRRDLDQAVQSGSLREELFFRLAVSRIELPPLREREGDVDLLARSFWKAMASQKTPFPSDVLQRYQGYRWPGNVRELRNVVARRLALGAFADAGEAQEEVAAEAADVIERVLALDLPLIEARSKIVTEFERRYLAKVLEAHGGNVSRAAAASGVARRYFQLIRARLGAKAGG